MNVYEPGRLLIIYGGKNDKRNVRNYSALYYTHMGILDLILMTWVNVKLSGVSSLIGRCSHVSMIVG
jgi:hypothetical protein